MDLMIVIAAAILAWVVGAIWFRLTGGLAADNSALQVRNIGDPRTRPVMPYLVAGIALVAVAAMIRVLFVRAGIDGILAGLGWGALIGAALVAPWFVIADARAPRAGSVMLGDIGYALIACAVIGAVMGGV